MSGLGQNGQPIPVALVFGTRPEAIKLAPLVAALRADARFAARVWITGQHRQMLDQVLDVFGIQPERDLSVMQPGQSLSRLTARLLESLDATLADDPVRFVVVQGDTASAMAGALAAFYRQTRIVHVEAGLRTHDLARPWPEEGNRQLIGRLADLHLAPTRSAAANLLAEHVPPARIAITGNTGIDALLQIRAAQGDTPIPVAGLPENWRERWRGRRLVLVTGHRRESFGDGFARICRALATLATRYPDTNFVYPVHLNPQVRAPVDAILAPVARERGNLFLIEPVPYPQMVALLASATVALTDSGGIQEEAPSFGVPVLVMRQTTERPEAVAAGTARLVGSDEAAIVDRLSQLLDDPAARAAMMAKGNPFGDGRAAERSVAALAALIEGRQPLLDAPFGGPPDG